MNNRDMRPKWLNRLAHSLCSVLIGFVAGAALFARYRFAEAVAVPAVAVAVIYLVGWAAWVVQRRMGGRHAAGA